MTEQDIDTAVAESMGFRDFQTYANGVMTGTYREDQFETIIPDYYNDLNAINDACESSLKNDQWVNFSLNLTEIYWGKENMPVDPLCHNMAAIRATAKQRAIAYLKTINKYK